MEQENCICIEDCAIGFNPNCECQNTQCHCREISNIIGNKKKESFEAIVKFIQLHYEMDSKWTRVKVKTKKWDYEYKFSKAGKTLGSFYLTKDCLGFMIIFGKEERAVFEQNQSEFSKQIVQLYNDTTTYHDGKWIMIELEDTSLLPDIEKLLQIKRKPNKK